GGDRVNDPLLRAAQRKADHGFQNRYCETVLKKHFPELRCDRRDGTDATIEDNDRVEKLIGTWLPQDRLVTDINTIPRSGDTNMPVWSDDYWRTRYGQTSYRYSEKTFFSSYESAVSHYSQPLEWEGLRGLDLSTIATRILPWSPAEKYDLTVGDETFALTNQQKQEGKKFRTPSGDVEEWM